MANLRLYLLGAPRVEVDGQQVAVDRRKALALLAYLALTPGAHSRDTLAALLWPGYTAATSRGNLRRTLSELNRTPAGGDLEIGRETVEMPRDGRVWSDVVHFETLLDGCRGHGHAPGGVCPVCREPLAQAVALYRDDFLAGFTLADSAEFDEWQTLQTAHLRRRGGEALARLVRCCLDAGGLDTAFTYAQRRLALDVLDEDAHRQLMQLYAWRGDRSAALRQYDDCARLLAAELGVVPQTATDELRAAIAADTLPSLPTLSAVTQRAHLEGHPEPMPTGELRLVTVLCAGPTASPDADAVEPLPQLPSLRAQMLDTLTAAGATAQPHLDDGVVGVFGLEQLHEDDAERAAVAGLALRDQAAASGVAVGVGLHTGRVYVAADAATPSLLGPVINLAARLRYQAAPGEILLSRPTYDLAHRGVSAAQSTSFNLPGANRALEVYTVERLRRRPRRTRGGEGLRAGLVGRDEEMGKLAAGLAELCRGKGGVVLLTGDAGVGKSRLVEELAERVTEPHTTPLLWLEGRCLEMTQAAAYAPFVSLFQTHLIAAAEPTGATLGAQLGAWLDELATQGWLTADQRQEMELLLARLLAARDGGAWQEALAAADPQQLQYRTFVVVRDFITALARRGPLVLALDDLHWADDLSLDLLGELLAAVVDAPLLLLCVYRNVPEHRSQQLARLAAQRCPDRVRRIQVAALALDQTAQLMTALLGGKLDASASADIQERTQGNPFFVEEIVRHQVETGALVREGDVWRSRATPAADALPVGVQSVILSRVDRLPGALRRLMRQAAVIGQTFDRALLAEVAQEADLTGALMMLEGRGFVYRTRTLPAPEYAFWHSLTQQAVYATLPQVERVTLHSQVGAAIERLHAANLDDHAVALAYHYDRSDARDKAIVYLLQAGEKLRRDYANEEAVAHFHRALERIDQLPPPALPPPDALDHWRYEAVKGLGQIYTTGGDLAQAEQYLYTALPLSQKLKLPPAEIVRLFAALGEVYIWRLRSAETLALAEEGLALLPDDQPSVELAVMNHYMWCSYWSKDNTPWRGLPYLERYAHFVHTLPYVEELRPPCFSATTYFLMHKDLGGALRLIQTLEDKAGARGDLRAVGEALLHRASTHWLQGDLAAALKDLSRAAEHMTRIGDILRLVWNLNFTAHIQLFAGQLAAARQSLHRRAQLIGPLGPQAGEPAEDASALLSLCEGDPRRALVDLYAMTPPVEEQPTGVRLACLLLKAELLFHAGDPTAARLPLDQAFTFFPEARIDAPALWCSFGPMLLLRLPLAEALCKLEAVAAGPDTFRARCQELRSRYPDFASEFTHWFLEPAQPDTAFGAAEVWLPHADMTWTDPLGDCRYAVGGDEVVLYAPNGRDLWQLNHSSPRLLRPVTGDFALECAVTAAHADRPAMGGLLLWQDEENYVRLHWGVRRPDEIGFDGNLANRDLGFGRGKLLGAQILLRLERRGSRVCALCRRADNTQWFTAGAVAFPTGGPLMVGIHAIGYIDRAVYPAAYADGTAIRFHSPHLAL